MISEKTLFFVAIAMLPVEELCKFGLGVGVWSWNGI